MEHVTKSKQVKKSYPANELCDEVKSFATDRTDRAIVEKFLSQGFQFPVKLSEEDLLTVVEEFKKLRKQ